eukprot:scaffold718_cov342-Pavlova_lutheri.AAC.1
MHAGGSDRGSPATGSRTPTARDSELADGRGGDETIDVGLLAEPGLAVNASQLLVLRSGGVRFRAHLAFRFLFGTKHVRDRILSQYLGHAMHRLDLGGVLLVARTVAQSRLAVWTPWIDLGFGIRRTNASFPATDAWDRRLGLVGRDDGSLGGVHESKARHGGLGVAWDVPPSHSFDVRRDRSFDCPFFAFGSDRRVPIRSVSLLRGTVPCAWSSFRVSVGRRNRSHTKERKKERKGGGKDGLSVTLP